jgi:hypothetical protein
VELSTLSKRLLLLLKRISSWRAKEDKGMIKGVSRDSSLWHTDNEEDFFQSKTL